MHMLGNWWKGISIDIQCFYSWRMAEDGQCILEQRTAHPMKGKYS